MYNYEEIKEVVQTFSKGFDGVEYLIMEWGREKASLRKPLKKILSFDDDGRYPAEYGSQSAANYLISLVLTNPKTIKWMHTTNDAFLTSRAKQVLSFWYKQPAFWCFFAVKEILKDDFLKIEDLLTQKTHLLYSPGICGMQKEGTTRNKHYLCLMLPNGECLQTVGILRFNSLFPSDLLFYCSLFESDSSLDTVINNHYSKFFMLDEISTMPVVMHNEHQMKYIWHQFTLPTFDISRLKGVWKTKQLGTQIQYSIQEMDESLPDEMVTIDLPIMGATIYRENTTGEMGLHANTEASYRLFASLLNKSYPELALPKKPAISFSMSLLLVLGKMDFSVPWNQFKELHKLSEEPDEKDADLEKTNLLLKQYMQAKNSGKAFDVQAFCKQEDLDIEEAKAVIQVVEKQYEKNVPSFTVAPKDKSFELSGWPVPPPALRHRFTSGLCNSKIFKLNENSETHKQFELITGKDYIDEIEEDGLCLFVENLFTNHLDLDYDLSFTLMNSFCWILYYKGNDWIPVRSYAIEMLKLFTYPITRLYPDPEQFIEEFSQFTRRILCTRGVCVTSSAPRAAEIKKGTFVIKGTDAFYSMFESIEM